MEQVQIKVNVGARIKFGGNRYHNRREYIVLAIQMSASSFYYIADGRIVVVSGDVEIL